VEAYLECGLLEKDERTAVLNCDPELEAQIFESVPADIWNYFGKITCPVLALRGELSDVFLPAAAQRMIKSPAAVECCGSGTGHFRRWKACGMRRANWNYLTGSAANSYRTVVNHPRNYYKSQFR
jgi:hypothetical protein